MFASEDTKQSKIMNYWETPTIVGIKASEETLHCCSGGVKWTKRERKTMSTCAKFGLRWWQHQMRAYQRVCPGGQHTFVTATETWDVSAVEESTFPGGIPAASSSAGDSIDESLKRADGVIRGILVVLRHHGAPHPVVDSFIQQARDYLVHPDEQVFFKRAKYLTVAPMARFLRQEMPKAPDVPFRFTGQFKNWATHRLRKYCRKNVHLWYSFLQAKRAALPLSDELVLTTYEEHRKAMEIQDPIDDNTHDSVMKNLTPHLKGVRKEMRRLLKSPDGVSSFRTTPSTSACQEVPRSKGGQAAEIRRLVPHIECYSKTAPTKIRRLPELTRMVFHPMLVQGGIVRYNVVVEEYSYPDGEREWRDCLSKEFLRYTRGERLTCTIQAVIEPLKIRVISKGEAMPYYFSKDLQKALHGAMRALPCYRLIGRPLCPTDLIDLSQNRCILGDGQYEWFSIDYSAATDNLSARLSASIMDFLTEGFPEEQRRLWKSVLAPHHVEYPEGFDVAPIDQNNGQLMGSILSFPVLCIANLGLYLENIKDDTRPLKDKLKGVLVNGDDMLYVAKHSMWDKHVEIGNKVGLKMSAGKAYCHSRYANANSACFDYDLYDRNATPWSIPFLNTGLYFGQSKVLADDKGDRDEGFCSTINRLVQGALPGKAPELLKQFVAKHSSWIDQECRGRNLFVPQSLGGMGVERPLGFTTKFTWQQKAVAKRLVESNPHGWLGSGPLPGLALTEELELPNPWDELDTEKEERQRLKSRATYSLLKDDDMEMSFRLCKKRACEAPSTSLRGKRKLSPEGQYRRDILEEVLAEMVADDQPVFRTDNPWVSVGKSLDSMIFFGQSIEDLLANGPDIEWEQCIDTLRR